MSAPRIIDLNGKRFRRIISEKEIKKHIKLLAQKLADSYRGKNVLLVCILKGASLFATDLLRELNKMGLDCELEFISLRSYQGTSSTGKVVCSRWLNQVFRKNLDQYHVIVVEDIVDTGKTFGWLGDKFTQEKNKPASLYFLPLFYKSRNHQAYPISIFVGHKFVVGYGLDYNGKGRGFTAIYEEYQKSK